MLFALGAAASAQDSLKQEISFSASWFNISNGDSANVTILTGEYGKFLQPNLELTVGLAYLNIGFSGDNVSLFGIAPGVSYYWSQNPDASWVPYVGAGFYYASLDTPGLSDNDTNFTYRVGVKNFFGKTMADADKALFIEYHGWGKIFDEVNVSGILVGISNFF